MTHAINKECNLEGTKNGTQHIHKIHVLQTGFRAYSKLVSEHVSAHSKWSANSLHS